LAKFEVTPKEFAAQNKEKIHQRVANRLTLTQAQKVAVRLIFDFQKQEYLDFALWLDQCLLYEAQNGLLQRQSDPNCARRFHGHRMKSLASSEIEQILQNLL
jgi:hypothetical protein